MRIMRSVAPICQMHIMGLSSHLPYLILCALTIELIKWQWTKTIKDSYVRFRGKLIFTVRSYVKPINQRFHLANVQHNYVSLFHSDSCQSNKWGWSFCLHGNPGMGAFIVYHHSYPFPSHQSGFNKASNGGKRSCQRPDAAVTYGKGWG